MRSAVLDVLRRLGGLAAVGDLRRAGVSPGAIRWALRCGLVVRAAPGWVADAARWQQLDPSGRHLSLVVAAVGRAGGAAAATAESAAALWGLPLQDGVPAVPLLVRPRSRTRPEGGARAPAAVRRRAWLDDDEITQVGGVPVTTLARTAVDMARTNEVPWGLAVADAVLRRGVAVTDLEDCVRRNVRAPGSRRARQVIGWADPRAESPLESVARGVVLLLGLPKPDLQVTVSAQGFTYRLDLLIREFRTVIEVDGKVKYEGAGGDPERSWQDKRRRDHLVEDGYEVARFVMADYWRPQRWGRSVLRTFHRACQRHGLPPPEFDPAFPAFPGTWHVATHDR